MPLNPDYVEKITDDEIVFRNYEGNLYRYPLKAGVKVDSAAKPVAWRIVAISSSADSGRTRARSNHFGSASVPDPAASWYVSPPMYRWI